MIENYREIMDSLFEKNIMFYDSFGGGIVEVIKFVVKNSEFGSCGRPIKNVSIEDRYLWYFLSSGSDLPRGSKHIGILEDSDGNYYLVGLSRKDV